MYAIIKTGGKQHRVEIGKFIDVELLDAEPGPFQFSEVLFSHDGSDSQIGSPTIENFLVYAEIIGQVSGEKVTGLKYKRSHNQCRKWGHRQKYTRVKITGIGSNRQTKEG